jgi:hypothetical protein
MISNVSQDGTSYECQFGLDCHNHKCMGEYELVTTFTNEQELWQCNRCKDRYFAYVTKAKYQFVSIKAANIAAAESVDDDTPAMNPTLKGSTSDVVVKSCFYCHNAFTTYDTNDDLCESCSYSEHLGYKN